MTRYLHNPMKVVWRRQWHPTPVLLPGKSHGWRSLVGCSPWGCKESDMTEQLHFHFPLSCIGEGNGNPLQCSCLENPRDGGAWWAAVYEVAQSPTLLKWLSSSSSNTIKKKGIVPWHGSFAESICKVLDEEETFFPQLSPSKVTVAPSSLWLLNCFR